MAKARRVLRALEQQGWTVVRQKGSHKTLFHPQAGNYTFAFHDQEEIGPVMLAKIAKQTGVPVSLLSQ